MSKRIKVKSSSKSHKGRGRSELTPIAGAGLIRFFKEETEGLSIPPYLVVILSAILIALVLSLPALLPL